MFAQVGFGPLALHVVANRPSNPGKIVRFRSGLMRAKIAEMGVSIVISTAVSTAKPFPCPLILKPQTNNRAVHPGYGFAKLENHVALFFVVWSMSCKNLYMERISLYKKKKDFTSIFPSYYPTSYYSRKNNYYIENEAQHHSNMPSCMPLLSRSSKAQIKERRF